MFVFSCVNTVLTFFGLQGFSYCFDDRLTGSFHLLRDWLRLHCSSLTSRYFEPMAWQIIDIAAHLIMFQCTETTWPPLASWRCIRLYQIFSVTLSPDYGPCTNGFLPVTVVGTISQGLNGHRGLTQCFAMVSLLYSWIGEISPPRGITISDTCSQSQFNRSRPVSPGHYLFASGAVIGCVWGSLKWVRNGHLRRGQQ